MSDFLEPYKNLIDQQILSFLNEKETSLQHVNEWGSDATRKYKSFITKGKSVRGGLFLALSSLFGMELAPLTPVAAALEILHSAVLIHDDIVDKDNLRRGVPTLRNQYKTMATSRNYVRPEEFGDSMSIIAGDIGIFWTFELLGRTTLSKPLLHNIIGTIAKEFVYVTLGEMQDIAISANPVLPSSAIVSSMYKYKTARYTFSLPFLVAGLLAEQNKEVLTMLDRLGESIGMVFQLKDDALSLFGDPSITGKTIGNDIRENKKTLYFLTLMTFVSNDEKNKIANSFDTDNVTDEAISFVLSLMKKYEIETKMNQEIDSYVKIADNIIDEAPFTNEQKDFFRKVKTYILQRDR